LDTTTSRANIPSSHVLVPAKVPARQINVAPMDILDADSGEKSAA
jgi:hypothetical protein